MIKTCFLFLLVVFASPLLWPTSAAAQQVEDGPVRLKAPETSVFMGKKAANTDVPMFLRYYVGDLGGDDIDLSKALPIGSLMHDPTVGAGIWEGEGAAFTPIPVPAPTLQWSGGNAPAMARVFDALGRLQWEGNFQDGRLDLGRLPNGTYSIQTLDGTGVLLNTQKVVLHKH